MKRAALLCYFLGVTVIASAQKINADSLKELLARTHVDSTRNQLLYKISAYYDEYNPDSCIYYANKLIDWGEKHKDLRIIIDGLSERSYARYSKGNFPAALEDCFHLLRLTEVVKDSTFLADNYNTIGNIYKGQQNDVQAIYYYRLCRQMAFLRKQKDVLTYSYLNLGYVYAANNNLDSALIYAKLALANGNAVYSGGYNDLILSIFGDIYFKKKDYPAAYRYFEKAYALTQKTGSFKKNSSLICISISKFFYQTGNRDSAIYYAKQSIRYANIVSYPGAVYESAALLSGYYENQQQTDSAFKYLKLSSATNDSLFNAAKYQEVDVLANAETNRQKDIEDAKIAYKTAVQMYVLVFVLLIFLAVGLLLWRNYRNKARAYNLLQVQKQETERQKAATEDALKDLKAAQSQLIQSEKMASLGQLTAGIAHEIQNPLNFVNNFSEVNREMLEELKAESEKPKAKRNERLEIELINDLIGNEKKISHHGKRADAIVKGMLEHSRVGKGEKQPTDLNALADEFLKLSYHGLRAKDKTFNAEFITHFDKKLPKANVVQQDIGRVLLNLFNNAFYAVNEKRKISGPMYKPTVELSISSPPLGGWGVVFLVRDNGVGIPDAIKDKIMQPFFTTKPTGEATGLGLSLSYDIVVKGHGGSIVVESKEGEFTEFVITLPLI
jgi:two-component system NtrC family sensor kinase